MCIIGPQENKKRAEWYLGCHAECSGDGHFVTIQNIDLYIHVEST